MASGIAGRLNVEDNQEASSLRGQNLDSKTPIWQHDRPWIRRPAKIVRATWRLLTARSRAKRKRLPPTVLTPGLGTVSVACLIFNRMIGSGIFSSSALIFYNTQSIGGSLMVWLYGVVSTMSGLLLYIELGLTIPNAYIQDTTVPTPRNGAELIYLNHFLKTPRYLATCLFGISFLVFGNTASSSVAFAAAIFQATGTTPTAAMIAGIAIAVNTFSCLLHGSSWEWGIRLNNLLGMLKMMMLAIIIIFGAVWYNRGVAGTNFDRAASFSDTTSEWRVNRYFEALAYVVFPFGGFQQANYVVAEIRNPRRNFAKTSAYAVGIMCILFVVINVLYAAIIPKDVLFQPNKDIALEFFIRTIGNSFSNDRRRVETFSGTLKAFSAIGNVVAISYTASRVIQEVARGGILPYSGFLASNTGLFSFRPDSSGSNQPPPSPDSSGSNQSPPGPDPNLRIEEAPVWSLRQVPAAAIFLHWVVTTILIIATTVGGGATVAADATLSLPGSALLATASSYSLDLAWPAVIGATMLYLRLWPRSIWRHRSPIPHGLGVVAAAVFTATTTFPLVAIWVPNPMRPFAAGTDGKVPWFAGQTMTLAVLAAAGAYWVGFKSYSRLKRLEMTVSRSPVFTRDPGRRPEWVFLYDAVRLQWKVPGRVQDHELGPLG